VAVRRFSGGGERHRGPTGSVCPWGGQTLRHPAGAVKSTAWVHHHVALGDGVYASLPLWRHRPTKLDGLPSALEWRMMLRAAHGGRRPLPSLFGCTEALAGLGIHRTRMRRAAAEWRQRGDRRATGTGDRCTAAWICTTGSGGGAATTATPSSWAWRPHPAPPRVTGPQGPVARVGGAIRAHIRVPLSHARWRLGGGAQTRT
jgi:hypothetical protein